MESGLTPGRYLDLSTWSYDEPDNQELPDGWSVVDHYQNSKTGYAGIAYQTDKGGIVVAHRGSDTWKDWVKANPKFVMQKVPKQFEDATDFVSQVFESKQQCLYIEHTGHSLGGALAQMVAHKYDSAAIAFDPPGTQEIIEKIPSLSGDINHEKFDTYIMKGSVVSGINTHIGNVTEINVLTDNPFIPDEYENNFVEGKDSLWPNKIEVHFLEKIKIAFDENGLVKEELISNYSDIEVTSDNSNDNEEVYLDANNENVVNGEQVNDDADGTGIAAELEANMAALYQNLNQFATAVSSI